MNCQIVEERVSLFNRIELDRLEGHCQRRLSGRLREFRLLIQGHGLVLQGRATTYYTKQLAQHAIMESTRVPIVANDIEVR